MTKRKSGRRVSKGSPTIIAILILASLALGILFSENLFAMTRVGDAFAGWTGVEIEGKFYPPDAGKGPSWSFRVDPDVGIPKVVTTTKTEPLRPTQIVTTGYFHFPTKGIYTYTIWSTPYTTYTYKTTVWPRGKPPSAYPEPGSPECGGIADLELRGVGGGGLYVTDSGMLVQAIEVRGGWRDTLYNVKCGHNWCSKPCGERMGDAWIFVKLDSSKLKGGRPIYVEVDPEYVEKWHSYVEAQASKIAEIRAECGGDPECERQLIYLGQVLGGDIGCGGLDHSGDRVLLRILKLAGEPGDGRLDVQLAAHQSGYHLDLLAFDGDIGVFRLAVHHLGQPGHDRGQYPLVHMAVNRNTGCFSCAWSCSCSSFSPLAGPKSKPRS